MNPRTLAERRVQLSADYSAATERLGQLKADRAIRWLVIRKDCKTDREADRTWEAMPDGQEEIKLTYKCKGLEKEISSINSLLRVIEGEARNQY